MMRLLAEAAVQVVVLAVAVAELKLAELVRKAVMEIVKVQAVQAVLPAVVQAVLTQRLTQVMQVFQEPVEQEVAVQQYLEVKLAVPARQVRAVVLVQPMDRLTFLHYSLVQAEAEAAEELVDLLVVLSIAAMLV
jgi:hypothetical protein